MRPRPAGRRGGRYSVGWGLGCVFVAGMMAALAAGAVSGEIHTTDGAPVPFAYVGLMTEAFEPVEQDTTGMGGEFSLAREAESGYLVVQPPPKKDRTGHQVHLYQPRIYRVSKQTGEVQLELPPAVTLILEAYDSTGALMRWADFQANGLLGGQFACAVNLDDEAVPAAIWPVHGALTGSASGSREEGLPGVLVEPGQAVAVNLLFWPTRGYGKLLLTLDNAGKGYMCGEPGDSRVLHVNYELARTAVHGLRRRQAVFSDAARQDITALEDRLAETAQVENKAEKAAMADAVLAEALRLRDELELARARQELRQVRRGTLEVQLQGEGVAWEECTLRLQQQRRDFHFGVFEGSPYDVGAFERARAAGFDMATVLLGWNWTQSPLVNKRGIDEVFGISRLRELGYRVKAHGVVWLQEYGILPERAFSMESEELRGALLEHQRALLEVFAGDVGLWEAMNEPANTNVPGVPREAVFRLLGASATNIAEWGRPTLVNGPHEFSYGGKYLIYNTDNTPAQAYPLTYSDFLRRAEARGVTEDLDIIGLQFYPGFHLNESFGGLEGPACTPARLLDTLRRYIAFGKPLHITEFSLPSACEDTWKSGYWRERWTPETQADYAEAVYTLAFAEPAVHSVTWWDILDEKPAVVSGGLIGRDGAPKPVFERLQALMKQWTSNVEKAPSPEGAAVFEVFGGEYELTLSLPDGRQVTRRVHVLERFTAEVKLEVGDGA